MTGSLRRSLSVAVVSLMAPVLGVLCLLLYLTVERIVWDAFDRALLEDAALHASLLQYDDEGYEYELGPRVGAAEGAPGAAVYLQVWRPDGEEIARSATLEAGPLPRELGAGLHTITLHDRAEVRLAIEHFVPAVDPEDAANPGLVAPGGTATVAIARETASTRQMLDLLVVWFLGLGLGTLALASTAASLAVGRGLRPLRRLADAIDGVGEEDLSVRVGVDGLASELVPIAARLDDLLGRLQASFDRERRFTAAAAHELRTPLATVRTELELGLRRQRAPTEYQATLQGALVVVKEMGELVEALLRLRRLGDGQPAPPPTTPVALAALVDSCWAPQGTVAQERGLRFENRVDPAVQVRGDPALVRLVVGNLLSNAAAYTEVGGWIRVESAPEAGIVLEVIDSGPPIPPGHVERLFDPFWRGDLARSQATTHTGLGLAVARAAARAAGLDLEAVNGADGTVRFGLVDPARSKLP